MIHNNKTAIFGNVRNASLHFCGSKIFEIHAWFFVKTIMKVFENSTTCESCSNQQWKKKQKTNKLAMATGVFLGETDRNYFEEVDAHVRVQPHTQKKNNLHEKTYAFWAIG